MMENGPSHNPTPLPPPRPTATTAMTTTRKVWGMAAHPTNASATDTYGGVTTRIYTGSNLSLSPPIPTHPHPSPPRNLSLSPAIYRICICPISKFITTHPHHPHYPHHPHHPHHPQYP